MGANILIKYLGEEKDNCPLVGAVAIANPWNLTETSHNLETSLSGIVYNFTQGLVNYASRFGIPFNYFFILKKTNKEN